VAGDATVLGVVAVRPAASTANGGADVAGHGAVDVDVDVGGGC
jgi:hypothetical protein